MEKVAIFADEADRLMMAGVGTPGGLTMERRVSWGGFAKCVPAFECFQSTSIEEMRGAEDGH